MITIFYFIFKDIFTDSTQILPLTALLALSFGTILYIFYEYLSKIEKQISQINDHLLTLKPTNNYQKDNFIKNYFAVVNENLSKVLNSAKKRESDKQKYNTKLKLKNRQRSDMLSAIAHEFRNPISAIIGYAQTLQEDQGISRPLQEKFLSKIANNGEKIEYLLSRLILWNKFESGEMKLVSRSFDLLALCRGVKQNLEEKYKNRIIKIEGTSSVISADITLIEIAIQNLVENALKYSKEDVIIKIDTDKLSIIDQGVGIGPEEITKVTKKFYRSGTHDWDNSMGLGLAIVKTILTLHKTQLEIQSIKNKGSIFFFSIVKLQ
jgi:signal transduction histidine kinase